MTDSVPEKLGKYKIIEEVGRGGFAAVYKAVDTTLDRTVAFKILAPHLLWDPTFVQRFQREAKIAANLDHPNIVTIHEVNQIEGIYFIAMQFLEGRTLSQILETEVYRLAGAGEIVRVTYTPSNGESWSPASAPDKRRAHRLSVERGLLVRRGESGLGLA